MDTLGSKIRSLRKARHMTQVDLGDGEVSASLISQIESNRVQPSPTVLEHICRRLGVEASYFTEYVQSNEYSQLYRRAKNLLEAQQYQEAAAIYGQLLEVQPQELKTLTLYNEAAQCYQHLKQYDKATLFFNRVAEISLENSDEATAVHTYYQLGNMQRNRNTISLAKMYWRRAHEVLERHPELNMPVSVKVHANLGRAYYLLGEYENARDCYKRALSKAEHLSSHLDLAIVCHGLANVLVEIADYQGAVEMTEKSLAMYESVRHQRGINQCKVNFIVILRHQRQYREAMDLLNQYLNDPSFYRDPIRHANALSERALCQLELQHPEEAIKDAEQSVLMVESDKEMWVALQTCRAKVYSRCGRYHDALLAIEKAKRSAHLSSVSLQRTLGDMNISILVQLGELSQATDLAIQNLAG